MPRGFLPGAVAPMGFGQSTVPGGGAVTSWPLATPPTVPPVVPPVVPPKPPRKGEGEDKWIPVPSGGFMWVPWNELVGDWDYQYRQYIAPKATAASPEETALTEARTKQALAATGLDDAQIARVWQTIGLEDDPEKRRAALQALKLGELQIQQIEAALAASKGFGGQMKAGNVIQDWEYSSDRKTRTPIWVNVDTKQIMYKGTPQRTPEGELEPGLAQQLKEGVLTKTYRASPDGKLYISVYFNPETGATIPTGEPYITKEEYLKRQPVPPAGERFTRPIGKSDPWGNEYVQDYERDPWGGPDKPKGDPYPQYTAAPAGLVGYRGPRGQTMSAMEVERLRAASEGQQVPGVSPGDWQALMTAQREEQSVGAAMGGLANEKYLQGVIGEATRLWPTLSLPERAAMADVLKGMGISFPGQPKTISFGGGTQAPAPSFSQELISQKPTGWNIGSAGWGAARQG